MNKKTISLLRLAVCMAFVMTLLIATAAPSLATTINAEGALVGTEQIPANAAITKCLAVGQETPTPQVTFTFQIDKVSLNDLTDSASLSAMPTITNKTITFGPADAYNSALTNAQQIHKRLDQTDYLYKEGAETLFPSTVNWTRSGIYVYRVTEQQSGFPYLSANEVATYSKAVYQLTVYVAEKTGGGFYVWAIGARRVTNDDGTVNAGNTGPKVDCRPGGPNGTYQFDFSKMIFTNTYLRRGGGGTTPTDGKLKISKVVTSLGADSFKYFEFDVTIRKPIISDKANYRVYVFEVNAQGQTVPVTGYTSLQNNVQNASLIHTSGAYIEYPLSPPGTVVRFRLRHNQFLSFSDIDAGATYVVNEQSHTPTDYTPSYLLTKSGTAAGTMTGTPGSSLSTPSTPPMTVTISPTNAWMDTAAFSNKFKDVVPTGIAVDDLPYFAIVAIAAIALGGYLFLRVKVRKNDEVAVEAN